MASLLENTGGPYGDDIYYLNVDVVPFSATTVRVTMRDANDTRWEVPNVIQLTPETNVVPQWNITIGTVGQKLNLVVTRASDNVVLFDTTNAGDIVYENQYLSIATGLPQNANIYGIGERAAPLKLPSGKTYTIFARDTATPYLQNVYGSHAFYMEMRDGKAHGVYLLNSNAMDVVLDPGMLTYKVIGGVLDFFFFIGPTPKQVVRQYVNLIGKPEMIPYWGLGWQQCRWGYLTLQETADVVSQYKAAGIPLEVMWNDIDYMELFRDFTTDPIRFPQQSFKKFVDQLHSSHQKYMMIIDPGIAIVPGYNAYDELVAKKLYILNSTGTPMVGMVWPGFTLFPDFTLPATSDYWTAHLNDFYKQVPFDGIWIDMNEVANFCDGTCKLPTEIASLPALSHSSSLPSSALPSPRGSKITGSYSNAKHAVGESFNPDNPPYKPYNDDTPIYSHTISLSAMNNMGMQYNTHTMYGLYESIATRKAADHILGKRSLVVSRSTFPGSGRYASHWLGDNHSTWEDMHQSIAGLITMGFFGIPHVGADICGFAGNTTKELCTRWIQLGAFYPFSRDHNALGMIPQEPYVFGTDVAKIASDVIKLKYTLLPYYYTLHYHAHMQGDPVARSLFYEFPQDVTTVENDLQLMIGSALLISPALAPGMTVVNAYFPTGYWYALSNGARTTSTGEAFQLDAPIDKINLHVRGGYIIPRQAAGMTTTESRQNPLQLIVALNETGGAIGDLFVDDGESLATIEQNKYSYFSFVAANRSIAIIPVLVNYNTVPSLNYVSVYGVNNTPNQVLVAGKAISKNQWTYSNSFKRLLINSLTISIMTSSTISWN